MNITEPELIQKEMKQTRREIDATITELEQEHGLLTPQGLSVGALTLTRQAMEREVVAKMKRSQQRINTFASGVENSIRRNPLGVAAAAAVVGALLAFSKRKTSTPNTERIEK